MTSHSIFSSFFFSTNAFHHVPFCGLKSTSTQSSRSGKLRGEGRVYWKRRAASLWERPEVEGHANQATALFRPLRPAHAWNGRTRVQARVDFVFIWCANVHACVWVCVCTSTVRPCSGFHHRLRPPPPPPSLNHVDPARRRCDWPSLRGGRVSPTAFPPAPDPAVLLPLTCLRRSAAWRTS